MNAENKVTRSMLCRMGRTQANAVMDAAGLTEDEKKKIILCYVEGRPMDIVADGLCVSSRALGRHLQRILHKMTSYNQFVG